MTPRNFLRDDDLTPDDQSVVLDLAARLKRERHEAPGTARPLAGPRSVALIFDKPTLRTQLSFSVGVAELGGHPVLVDGRMAGIGARESIEDVTRVLDRQVAAIVWRTSGHDRIERMAAVSAVPVINALTDDFHPCQVLADLQTIRERTGRLHGVTLAYLGDTSNNMAHSYLLGGATAGLHVRLAGPEQYAPRPDVVASARRIAERTGGSITVTTSAQRAVDGADVIATDTWVSMGQEAEAADRETPFRPYAVTTAVLAQSAPAAVVLHCLPAYRGKEIAADVIDGSASAVWDEAENRLHAQKALLTVLTRTAVPA